jgi:hypothetical protein
MPFDELPSYVSSDVSPIFIGGTTQNFFFDFGLKKANSTLECPLKIYEQDVGTLTSPVFSGWNEITNQYELNMLKFNDGNSLTKNTTTNGMSKALLIEIDLTNLCNALFGIGKNDLFEAALIKANFNVITNDATMYVWDDTAWTQCDLQNEFTASDLISKITSDNKIYIGLISNNVSDGTVASTVSLEYMSVKISLKRAKDVIMNPPTVNVPNKFTVIMKGVAPAWDASNDEVKGLFSLYKDAANSMELYTSAGKFSLKSNANNYDMLNGITNEMFQNMNIMFEQMTNGNKRIRLLTNNGTLSKFVADTDSNILLGQNTLYPLYGKTEDKEGDCFIESLQFLPNTNFEDDAVAEAMLRGTASGYENPELVNNYNFEGGKLGWDFDEDTEVINDWLVLDATDGELFKSSLQTVAVYPNNMYKIEIQSGDEALTRIEFCYNDIEMSYSKGLYGNTEKYFITPAWCNNIKIRLTNYKAGTFTWKSISLKRFDSVAPNGWKTNDDNIDSDYHRGEGKLITVDRVGTALSEPINTVNYVGGNTLATDNILIKKGKSLFVGGDTATFFYDFTDKVAGSNAECPLKIYRGLIDPANPPTPTDTTWIEITDQKAIDKLKTQDEVASLTVDVNARTAVWNGINLVQQSTTVPAVRDDFAGKIGGSTVQNPNIASYCENTNLLSPTTVDSNPAFGFVEFANSYTFMAINSDSKLANETTSVAGRVPQIKLSFNIVEMIRRKYGNIPSDGTLAGDVAWCKANLSNNGYGITCNIYGYGVSPTGNKLYLPYWFGNTWQSANTITTSSPSLINRPLGASPGSFIDSNGFVYFLVYTDPAQTTNPNFIVMANHVLTVNDIVENSTRNNLFSTIKEIKATTNVIILDTPITGQVPGDTINKYIYQVDKVSETGTTESQVVITNHGLTTGDYVKNVRLNTIRKIKVIDANTISFEMPELNPITGQVVGDTFKLYEFTTNQAADATVVPSTVYVDYASIDVQLKGVAGYDILVPSNPRRDAGLGNVVYLEKVYNKITDDYAGKTQGNTTVPHIAKVPRDAKNLMLPSDNGLWARLN